MHFPGRRDESKLCLSVMFGAGLAFLSALGRDLRAPKGACMGLRGREQQGQLCFHWERNRAS